MCKMCQIGVFFHSRCGKSLTVVSQIIFYSPRPQFELLSSNFIVPFQFFFSSFPDVIIKLLDFKLFGGYSLIAKMGLYTDLKFLRCAKSLKELSLIPNGKSRSCFSEYFLLSSRPHPRYASQSQGWQYVKTATPSQLSKDP